MATKEKRKAERTPASTRAQAAAKIGIIMGSQSDWATMQAAAHMLDGLKVSHETRIVSAHRTPDLMFEYAEQAQARGLRAIIAGAGGAAHLPGMTASMTTLPVLGVPVLSKSLQGIDALLSIAQMPKGVPVGTLAIGKVAFYRQVEMDLAADRLRYWVASYGNDPVLCGDSSLDDTAGNTAGFGDRDALRRVGDPVGRDDDLLDLRQGVSPCGDLREVDARSS